jgi:hypothetical protein
MSERIPNTYSPEEVRRAMVRLVSLITQLESLPSASIVAADIVNWNESHSRELSFDGNLNCLVSNI